MLLNINFTYLRMVFYNNLPTELWFIIYKIEHIQNWQIVLKDIKNFNFNNDHMIKCDSCGLEWDGNAQCLCFENDDFDI